MKDKANDISIDDLVRKTRNIINRTNIENFLKGSTGPFIPGCAGLPAGSIIAMTGPRSKAERGQFCPGQLIAFDCYAADSTKVNYKTFFTPLFTQPYPEFFIIDTRRRSNNSCTIELECSSLSDGAEIWLSILPWITQNNDNKRFFDNLETIGHIFNYLSGGIRFELEISNATHLIDPRPTPGKPDPGDLSENLLFPLNYVRSTLSPFIFQIDFEALPREIYNELTAEPGKRFNLNISIDEHLLGQFYKKLDPIDNSMKGISVNGNVLAMMNLEIHNWDPKLSFSQFVRRSDLLPIGIAGISTYKKHEINNSRESELISLSDASVFFNMSMEGDRGISIKYDIPELPEVREKSLLSVWMSLSDKLNGYSLRYRGGTTSSRLFPTTNLLTRVETVIPCCKGRSLDQSPDLSCLDRLLYGFGNVPQHFLTRNNLIKKVNDIFNFLGINNINVEEPINGTRIYDGKRMKIIVIPISGLKSGSRAANAVKIVETYINNNLPIGVIVQIESLSNR